MLTLILLSGLDRKQSATHLHSSRAHTVLAVRHFWIPSAVIREDWGRLGRGLP